MQTRIAQYEMAFRMQTGVPNSPTSVTRAKRPRHVRPQRDQARTYAHAVAHPPPRRARRRRREILHRVGTNTAPFPPKSRTTMDGPAHRRPRQGPQRPAGGHSSSSAASSAAPSIVRASLPARTMAATTTPCNFCIWMAGRYSARHNLRLHRRLQLQRTRDPCTSTNPTPQSPLHGIDHSRFTFPFQGLD